MKNLFCLFLFSFVFSIIFFSCNKDDTSTPTGGNTNTGPVTQTFNSTPGLNKFITNAQPVFDTISANITDNITANNISDVKLAISDVSGVEVNKIKFSLIHGGVEVAVIDSLTKSGVGNFTNTVLWDSSGTLIDQGVTPYTGTFKPQHPLNGFANADPAGKWIIKITYSGALKTGVIKSWGITITYQVTQPSSNGIWPLATGNIWITEKRDTLGNLTRTDTMKILYSTTYQNKTVYRLYASDMNNSDSIFLRNESDGLWAYNISQNWSQFIYKYPVNVGEWWIGGGNGDTVKCISTNETVVTLSGTHTGCIKYQVFDHYQGNVSFNYEFVKPGLGPVGSDHYNNSGMSITQTFFSYPSLNKFITNAQPVFDTIYASILQNYIADVRLTLDSVQSVEVDKIKFSIWHNGIEVSVIDALTKTGVGNFINTVFFDSSGTPIDQGQSPYTGIFKPQHPLSSFNYADAGGQWILKIIYTGSLKTGLLKSWSVTITYTNQPQTILQSRVRLKEYHLYP